jgi:hypothetical protein
MFDRPFKITDAVISDLSKLEWTPEAFNHPVTFFIGHARLVDLGQLRDLYPDGKLTVVYNPTNTSQIAYYQYDAPTPLHPITAANPN